MRPQTRFGFKNQFNRSERRRAARIEHHLPGSSSTLSMESTNTLSDAIEAKDRLDILLKFVQVGYRHRHLSSTLSESQ